MAESPAHKLGQLIGDMIENALAKPLHGFAKAYGLFLDRKGPRKARSGKKVTWLDNHGNAHDLDFVLERRGSETKIGHPVAFVEVAWRSYTKHSRNKAQEMQGAITPLRDTYSEMAPFMGAVLGGVFTNGSLQQLRSHGFGILFLPHEAVVAAFAKSGVDVEFGEGTSETVLAAKVTAVEELGPDGLAAVGEALLAARSADVDTFFEQLREKIVRKVSRVVIVQLFGEVLEFATLAAAMDGLAAVARTAACASSAGVRCR